ncbi:MAG: hypothetical protein KGM47_07335, partial [Acidobacteriota bacterium]|nr:hypothetical protein [Acidobacteriota bacterium]
WERMSGADEIGYCPLAFGYSNYARRGYRPSLVTFTNIPAAGPSGPAGATLGGAGLAVSRRTRSVEIAVAYALWAASEECQRTIYVQSGGQPAHRQAWTSPDVNSLTNNFFKDTLPTIEKSFLRPRGAGFIDFQTRSAALIAAFLRGEHTAAQTLDLMDECYAEWNRKRRMPA